MTNAQNGARIKAWAGKDVGSGIVKNITFEHFVESNVDNPLIVDQVCMLFYLLVCVALTNIILSATRRMQTNVRSIPRTLTYRMLFSRSERHLIFSISD